MPRTQDRYARERRDEDRGRGATKPTELPARGWKEILWRVYAEFSRDNVMLVAGGVTFYLLLAIFPALTAFVSIFGLVADPATISQQVASLEGVLPEGGAELIESQLVSLAEQEGGALTFGFLISLGIALWSANSGMKAIIEALNIAYEEEEKRGFIKLTLVAFAFTLGAMLLAAVIIIAVGVVPAVLAIFNLEGVGEWLLRLLRWPILIAVVALFLAVLYRFGPSREVAEWRWVSWGSGIATVVWLVTSIAFSIYLENFADYNATYGSLGALIGFLLWIWISMMIVIIGAELNAEMEHQTAEDTTTAPQQPMGRRGAKVADTVAE